MNKILELLCCALGSGMIGYFANQLHTPEGGFLFAIGVVLMVCSVLLMNRKQ